MLNNLISNPHHYTAPNARKTNTKASVNNTSNSIRDMFMTSANELEILLPNTTSQFDF